MVDILGAKVVVIVLGPQRLQDPDTGIGTTLLNRTGFLGDLIAWEDGVYGTSKSVFSGGA